jgi:hypothetical protein
MVCRLWAAAVVPGLLGIAVALDLLPAADRPLAPGATEGLDSVWVMHTIAELVKQNAERKAELRKEREDREVERQQERQDREAERRQERELRGALEAQVQAQNLRVNALALRVDENSSCECPPPRFVDNATSWRQLQGGADAASDFVRIFKRTLTTAGGADGHRRLRVLAEVECSKAYIKKQTNRINVECCDEPSEICSGGNIGICNEGCAALVNPLWAACQAELGPAAAVLAAAADRCSAPPPPAGVHAVKQIFVTCPANAIAANCVPRCEPETNGDLLLLNMDGDDTKLTCELHQDKYSWVGSSADGGYYGSDALTFFAAVRTGAAGTYILDLGEDAHFRTDIVIGLGQSVVITGDPNLPAPLAWGTGGFKVNQFGSLSLTYVQLDVVRAVSPA